MIVLHLEQADMLPPQWELLTSAGRQAWETAAVVVTEPISKQAKVLLVDVDDMMVALRDVASIEYTRDEVRDQAKRVLDRLRARGIGDDATGVR
jgi:hypothetical protein